MKVVTARCQMCRKSFLITSDNKDFIHIQKNPKFLFHCEQCALQIQLEARRERYYKLFPPNITA